MEVGAAEREGVEMEIEEEVARTCVERLEDVEARESQTPRERGQDEWAGFAEMIGKKVEEKKGEKKEIVAEGREGGIRRPVSKLACLATSV